MRQSDERLDQEITELVSAWEERTAGRDPERSTYQYFAILQPFPDLPNERS
ncbi:hypothetical protein [Nakamurella lactea]|uniref:hypothetical protein n=1 Tax=Nakamurella lactea TaxID=459515 RepID=UPI000404307F|nr:hypothetical protein [Nakamurella lactea]